MHLVAIARAAGIALTWDDLSDLSAVVPLAVPDLPQRLGRREPLPRRRRHRLPGAHAARAGLLHEDVLTIMGRGLRRYTQRAGAARRRRSTWEEGPKASLDLDVLRPADDPFAPDGGLKVLARPARHGGHQDLRGRARAPRRHRARRWSSTTRPTSSPPSREGRLDGRDLVAVIRYQGPAANGMPELHKLTPALGVLQDRGQRVAIVTDGRMSGASGKVPAAIHVTPEAAARRTARRGCATAT